MSDLPSDYRTWQEALSTAFFTQVVGPIVLFVDDSELARLPGGPDRAVSLASAVDSMLPMVPHREVFAKVVALQDIWASGDRFAAPPTLPVLAISVLAATRMAGDADASSSNYYLRLAQAMLPGSSDSRVNELRLFLRNGGFRDVAEMWRTLDEWIRLQWGDGVSTIRADPHLTLIGYPRSQALLRRDDRAVLTQFFSAVVDRESTSQFPSGVSLLKLLRLWAQRPRGLSGPAEYSLNDPVLEEMMAALIDALANNWDGVVVTPEGLPRLGVRLSLDLDQWSTSWTVGTADGVDSDVLNGAPGGSECEIEVARDGSRPSYSLRRGQIPLTERSVHDGFRLRGRYSVAEWAKPAGVMIFRDDADVGGWSTVSSTLPYEEHLLAVRQTHKHDVEQILGAAADSGWRVVSQHKPLLPGWILYESVVLAEPHALQAALTAKDGPAAFRSAGLGPDVTTRPRLCGGLPLARTISSSAYLVGGEPDLLLPVGDIPRRVSASLDGIEQKPEFLASGFPIELRRIGNGLAVGDHKVSADGYNLRFTLLEAQTWPATGSDTATIGWDDAGLLRHGSVGVVVVGARFSDSSATAQRRGPLLCRRGRDETWLLMRDGACVRVEEPGHPAFLARIGVSLAQHFEVIAPPDAAWIADRKGARWTVRRVAALPPGFRAFADRSHSTVWQAVAPHGNGQDPLWRSYIRSWESLHVR